MLCSACAWNGGRGCGGDVVGGAGRGHCYSQDDADEDCYGALAAVGEDVRRIYVWGYVGGGLGRMRGEPLRKL